MKYLLMMNTMKSEQAPFPGWSPEDIQRHIGFMISFVKGLAQSGELVAAEGLSWPSEAKLVRAGDQGEVLTDGVFPETKEFLAGFWIVDVEHAQRAYELAAQISAAPGLAGAPMKMAIEVRQIMSGPPPEFL